MTHKYNFTFAISGKSNLIVSSDISTSITINGVIYHPKEKDDILNYCKMGNIDEVREWISENDILDIQNADGNTPLHAASYYGYLDIVRLLLENGANKNIPNKDNNYPIDFATMTGHKEIVKLLDGWSRTKMAR